MDMLNFTVIMSLLVISIAVLFINSYNERERLAQQMNEKAEREAAANEAKSSFLSNMSHEIRTPINAVLGMNEMILRESGEQKTLEYAGNIRTAGNALLGLVNDILDFSKIEAGKMEIMTSPPSSTIWSLWSRPGRTRRACSLNLILTKSSPGVSTATRCASGRRSRTSSPTLSSTPRRAGSPSASAMKRY